MKTSISKEQLKHLKKYNYTGTGTIGGMIKYLGNGWFNSIASISKDWIEREENEWGVVHEGLYEDNIKIIDNSFLVDNLYKQVEREAHKRFFENKLK